MDRFLAAHSWEAVAHSLLNDGAWDNEQLTNEGVLAGSAVYRALERYISGESLFIYPRTRLELDSILRRYAYDAIHNAISRARSNLKAGGYSRMLSMADRSIRELLNTGENTDILLNMHQSELSVHETEMDERRWSITSSG